MCRRGVSWVTCSFPIYSPIEFPTPWGSSVLLTLDSQHFLTSPKNFQSFISQLSRQFVLDNHQCNLGNTFQPWGLNKKWNCFLHFFFVLFCSTGLPCPPVERRGGLSTFLSLELVLLPHLPSIKQVDVVEGNVWRGSSSKGNTAVATFCKEINLNGVVCACTRHLRDWEFHWVQQPVTFWTLMQFQHHWISSWWRGCMHSAKISTSEPFLVPPEPDAC